MVCSYTLYNIVRLSASEAAIKRRVLLSKLNRHHDIKNPKSELLYSGWYIYSVFSRAMAGINNLDFSKLVFYGYLIHHENPRIMKYYTHSHSTVPHRCADGAPYPAWFAMGNAAAAAATEPAAEDSGTQHAEGLGHLYITPLRKKRFCCLLLKIAYVVKCIFNILLSIAVIAVTVSTAIAMKIFSSDQSGRLVAMIILSVTSAITLSMTIYAMVAVLRRQTKPVHLASVVLLVLAVIEAIIISVSVRVTERDEINISRSLSESFNLAAEDNPRHVKIWATIQYDLECCGVYSPQDYLKQNVAPFFAPDVPISCCPGYDPNRSELVQERERQMCKARQQYYDMGCRNPIMEMYRETAKLVIAITSSHIAVMLLLVIVGAILSRKMKKKLGKTEEASTSSAPELTQHPKILLKAKTNTKV